MTKENFITRRKFLAGASAVSAGLTIVPRFVLGGVGQVAPSEKLNIAGIGIGGMGASNLRNVESENMVALCDVDDEYAAKTFQRYPQAKRYRDYRKMLAEQQDIDAVVIATPDHTHAVIAMAAMKAGKHVYCQKPLTHNVYESRLLAAAAKEEGVVTQMGIQHHSSNYVRLLREWIQDGAIGEVHEVVAWSSLTYYPWGHAWWSTTHENRPKEKPEVPVTLDWDLWLGPAAERPYHPCYHPAKWRAWWDFGCGMMGDRGVHTFDPIFWALDLKYPDSIEATNLGGNEETHPLGTIVTYQFPARGSKVPVKLTWYDGIFPPRPDDLEDGRQFGGSEGGIYFIGAKGSIMSGYMGDSPRIVPEAKMKAYKQPEPTIPRVEGSHEQDWIRAIKSGGKAGADFAYSGPLTEAVLLGNVAKRVDGRIHWDGANMKVTNNADANQYLKRVYRDPWSL
ncbi:MAG: Gfo/Idh/MocA family oxidoreductase [Sedimentisphaerales bacterium]|nr:Gfo/Idh/MocA family oxidoreductase [Sedimentisphaerales bacterium]